MTNNIIISSQSLAKQLDSAGSGTIIRPYRAKTQSDAANLMCTEAQQLLAEGYYPVSEHWSVGSWSAGDFILALFACIFCIGVFAFLYMLIVKPNGTLTVTYQRKDVSSSTTQPDSKCCPRCAETVKWAAKACRFCGYEFEQKVNPT